MDIATMKIRKYMLHHLDSYPVHKDRHLLAEKMTSLIYWLSSERVKRWK